MKKSYLIKNEELLIEELLRKFRFINIKESDSEYLIFDNRLKNLWEKWKNKEKIFYIKKEKIRERWYFEFNCDNNLTLKELREIIELLENYIE